MYLCVYVGAGQDKLFSIVYEKNKHKKTNLEPHLWSYRQRVSLEHLGQTLQDAQLKEKCPILHDFLEAVSCLVDFTDSVRPPIWIAHLYV